MPTLRAYARDFFPRFFLERFGYRHGWLARSVIRSFGLPDRFGKDLLDQKIIDRIDTSPNFYIEIGANDGVRLSNTLALELYFGWRGILLEPISKSFRALEKNRSRRRNVLLNIACVASDNKAEKVEMIYCDLMSIALGLDSDVSDPSEHAIRGSKFLKPGVELRREVVEASTMTSALVHAEAPESIGFLSLDVEGAELEVLRGIDFHTYHIEWILVESRNPERIATFLRRHGYRMREALSTYDFLFHKDFEPEFRGH